MMIHRRLFALTHGVRGKLVSLITLGLLISVTYVSQGILTARIIENIFRGLPWQASLAFVAGILGLALVRAALQWMESLGAKLMVVAIKEQLRVRLYTKLIHLGVGYLIRERTGTVQATILDGVQHLEGYLSRYIPQCFVAVVAPIPIIAFLYLVNPLIALIVVVCMALIPLTPGIYSRLLGAYGSRHWEDYKRLNAQFLDAMQGMTTLKAFNASSRHGMKLQSDTQRLYRSTMLQLMISLIGSGFIGLLTGIGSAAAIGMGSANMAIGQATAAEVLLILLLVGECFRPLLLLDRYWHVGFSGISAGDGIMRLLDAEPTVVDSAKPVIASLTTTRPSFAFENVTFRYNEGAQSAISQLSFTVAPGETVALVGRSGAGKSTVVALLLRLFDPQSGRVTLDGHDLRMYSLESLRTMLAVVSQDTYLFYGSIAENLRLAKPAATQAELEATTKAANIHDFICALPQGYDTIVGERGLSLSGGERQRLAIARALLKDAPILILDEATSNVDTTNEAAIQAALERLTRDRTSLIIAHRLSTVAKADRIIVLEAGAAVETGIHHELLAHQGSYARLVAAQM